MIFSAGITISFRIYHKRQKAKMNKLKKILDEKNEILQNNQEQLHLEDDYHKKVSDMRETLNREIFELQKDLFEKISKK